MSAAIRALPQSTPRLLVALSGWAALLTTALAPANPLRVVVTGVFLLGCPGVAVILAARPVPAERASWSGLLEASALALALSVAIATLTAEALFLAHAFTTARALAALACLTTVLALFPRRHRPGRERSAPGQGTQGADPATEPRRRLTRRSVARLVGAGLLLLTAACGGAAGGTTAGTTGSAAPRTTSGADSGSSSAAADRPVAPGPWHPVFRDDFTGPGLDRSNWTTCFDWNDGGCTNAGNNEQEWYQPGQVSATGGALTLSADRRATRGSDGKSYPWASGMVSTGRDSWNGTPRHTFTYGYYAAAIQAPADAAGLFPAFWLIPAEARGTPPELDVAEFINTNQHVDMNLHWRTADGGDTHIGQTSGPADFASGYHVFAMDWEPNSVTWYVDGVQRFEVTRPSVIPSVAMELVINLAVGFQESPPSAVDSAQLHVGWVGVWQH